MEIQFIEAIHFVLRYRFINVPLVNSDPINALHGFIYHAGSFE